MKHYRVATLIQSGDLPNPPATIDWYNGTSAVKAMSALAQCIADDEAVDHGDLPESMRYSTLAVYCYITEED